MKERAGSLSHSVFLAYTAEFKIIKKSILKERARAHVNHSKVIWNKNKWYLTWMTRRLCTYVSYPIIHVYVRTSAIQQRKFIFQLLKSSINRKKPGNNNNCLNKTFFTNQIQRMYCCWLAGRHTTIRTWLLPRKFKEQIIDIRNPITIALKRNI